MRLIALIELALAAVAVLLALSTSLGYRWQIWTLATAFGVLRWVAYTGLAAGAVSVLAARRRSGRVTTLALAALLTGAAVAAVPF